MAKTRKVFYLAKHVDEDIHSRTYFQVVIRRVNSDGYDKGLQVGRWMRVVAADMAEARQKFEAGEGMWFS